LASLELLVTIDPVRRELYLPAVCEQRLEPDFAGSVEALLAWLQPHLFASKNLRPAAELLYKNISTVHVIFDRDPRNYNFLYVVS